MTTEILFVITFVFGIMRLIPFKTNIKSPYAIIFPYRVAINEKTIQGHLLLFILWVLKYINNYIFTLSLCYQVWYWFIYIAKLN